MPNDMVSATITASKLVVWNAFFSSHSPGDCSIAETDDQVTRFENDLRNAVFTQPVRLVLSLDEAAITTTSLRVVSIPSHFPSDDELWRLDSLGVTWGFFSNTSSMISLLDISDCYVYVVLLFFHVSQHLSLLISNLVPYEEESKLAYRFSLVESGNSVYFYVSEITSSL